MPPQRLNPYCASSSVSELKGRRTYTLKPIREYEFYCRWGDEIKPQRLGGNIWNGEPFVQEQAKSNPRQPI
jgi:hypothetical protein